MHSLTVGELKEILESYDTALALSVRLSQEHFLDAFKNSLEAMEGAEDNRTLDMINDIVMCARETLGDGTQPLVAVKPHQSGSARRKVVLEGAP